MTDATFHTTRQDLRKAEARLAEQHGGNPPADSDVSKMKVSSYPYTVSQHPLTLPSPSSTRTPTSPSKLTTPRPTYLCPISPLLPLTGTLPTSVPSTLALAASRRPSPAKATALFEDPPLQLRASVSMAPSCTRTRPPVALSVAKRLRA